MRAKRRQTWLLCLLLAAQGSWATVEHAVGIARDSQDQSLRYVEHHQYLPSGEHLIRYFDHRGKLLVSKALIYPGLPQHPQIEQTDVTSGVQISTSNNGNKVEMRLQAKDGVQRFSLGLDASTIVDAGFDRFIRSQWQRFEESDPQVYKLVVAGKKRVLPVSITKLPADSAANDPYTSFSIEPRNLFIRWLVPEMRVSYDQQRRLVRYQGLTNLDLAEAKDAKVSIEFKHYTSTEKLNEPLAQWLPSQGTANP